MIECRQVELERIFHQYAGEPLVRLPFSVDLGDLNREDKCLLAKISESRQGQKFSKLFDGDWRGDYESQSEADLSLCNILAFWCQKDAGQIDKIFRQSKLFRQKWDDIHGQQAYGAMTIGKAIDRTNKVYDDNHPPTPKAKNANRFELVQAGSIVVKPPQWLVQGLIEHDSLALVFGDPGCGKSLWSIAIALCIATGTPFFGQAVKQGPVVYIAGEGHQGIGRRLMAWSNMNEVNHDNAPLYISKIPAALTDSEMVVHVQAEIERITTSPVLIVIDTLARNFGPGDENSTQDMSQFVQAADLLRASSQATVLIVHHSGHGDKGRARGAMALKGALDAEYRLDKDENGIVRMEATKMKEAKHPDPTAYLITTVDLTLAVDGVPFSCTSATLLPTSYSPQPQRGKAGQGKHQIKALGILKEQYSQARQSCADRGGDPATVRVSTEEWKRAMKNGSIPQQRVAEVVASLKSTGRVTEGGGFVSPL